MALHSDTEIYAAVVDLAKFAMTAARQMPRDAKPLFGASLRDECVWLGVLVMRMNKARDTAKLPHIEEILEHVEIVTFTLRLARELHCIAPKTFADSLPLTVMVGKQATAIRNHFAPAH